jgi:hypothetical protein
VGAALPNGLDLKAFEAIEDRFNDAVVSNDVKRIAQCISDDWVLVTPERGPIGREAIFLVIDSGTLAHNSMTKLDVRAKVQSDTASRHRARPEHRHLPRLTSTTPMISVLRGTDLGSTASPCFHRSFHQSISEALRHGPTQSRQKPCAPFR